MIKFKCAVRNFSATLCLRGKYNIIAGNSGTGKTYLQMKLAEIAGAKSARYDGPGRLISADIMSTAKTSDLLSNMAGSVFVLDEGIDLLYDKRGLELIKSSQNYFIIMARENFNRLPYGVHDIFDLRGNEHCLEMIPMFDAARTVSETITLNDMIVCEGEGLDFFALKQKYPVCVLTSKGKDNLSDLLASSASDVFVIADWCGTAGATVELIRTLERSNIRTIFSPSFEYELLGNRWVFGIDCGALRSIYEDSLLDFQSEEACYTQIVDTIVGKGFGLSYSKAGHSAFASLILNGKVLVNKQLLTGEPQPVKLDWLYPELKVEGDTSVSLVRKLKFN